MQKRKIRHCRRRHLISGLIADLLIKTPPLNTYHIFPPTCLNPIPAGVLENQDMLGGGGQFDPPPLNPMFDVQI